MSTRKRSHSSYSKEKYESREAAAKGSHNFITGSQQWTLCWIFDSNGMKSNNEQIYIIADDYIIKARETYCQRLL